MPAPWRTTSSNQTLLLICFHLLFLFTLTYDLSVGLIEVLWFDQQQFCPPQSSFYYLSRQRRLFPGSRPEQTKLIQSCNCAVMETQWDLLGPKGSCCLFRVFFLDIISKFGVNTRESDSWENCQQLFIVQNKLSLLFCLERTNVMVLWTNRNCCTSHQHAVAVLERQTIISWSVFGVTYRCFYYDLGEFLILIGFKLTMDTYKRNSSQIVWMFYISVLA